MVSLRSRGLPLEALVWSRVGCACKAKARASEGSRCTFLGLAAGAAGLLLLPARAWGKKLAVALDKLPMLRNFGGWTIAKLKGPATARLTPSYPATLDASKQRVIIELP